MCVCALVIYCLVTHIWAITLLVIFPNSYISNFPNWTGALIWNSNRVPLLSNIPNDQRIYRCSHLIFLLTEIFRLWEKDQLQLVQILKKLMECFSAILWKPWLVTFLDIPHMGAFIIVKLQLWVFFSSA